MAVSKISGNKLYRLEFPENNLYDQLSEGVQCTCIQYILCTLQPQTSFITAIISCFVLFCFDLRLQVSLMPNTKFGSAVW